jgi:hypothetical protein
MKRISVNLTEQQIATVHQIARETGLKFAEVLRRLIDDALKAQRQQSRC